MKIRIENLQIRQVKNCQDFTYKDKIYVLFTHVYRLCLCKFRFCLCKFTDSVYTGLQILFTKVYRFCFMHVYRFGLHMFTDYVYTGLQILSTQVCGFCLHRFTGSILTLYHAKKIYLSGLNVVNCGW